MQTNYFVPTVTLRLQACHSAEQTYRVLWKDIDLETRTLQVRRTLTAGAAATLKRHRERQLEERERLAGLWQEHGLVFATEVGTPLHRGNLSSRSFKPLLEKAGLPHSVRFHDLRHTSATLLLGQGVHPTLGQELLGHSNGSVTLDTYSHVLPGMGDQAASAIVDALCDPEVP